VSQCVDCLRTSRGTCVAVRSSKLQSIAVRCSVLQCVTACCSVLQRVAACCSMSIVVHFERHLDAYMCVWICMLYTYIYTYTHIYIYIHICRTCSLFFKSSSASYCATTDFKTYFSQKKNQSELTEQHNTATHCSTLQHTEQHNTYTRILVL